MYVCVIIYRYMLFTHILSFLFCFVKKKCYRDINIDDNDTP